MQADETSSTAIVAWTLRAGWLLSVFVGDVGLLCDMLLLRRGPSLRLSKLIAKAHRIQVFQALAESERFRLGRESTATRRD
jgi:hypothetical protein